jgi:hypothetical protein
MKRALSLFSLALVFALGVVQAAPAQCFFGARRQARLNAACSGQASVSSCAGVAMVSMAAPIGVPAIVAAPPPSPSSDLAEIRALLVQMSARIEKLEARK